MSEIHKILSPICKAHPTAVGLTFKEYNIDAPVTPDNLYNALVVFPGIEQRIIQHMKTPISYATGILDGRQPTLANNGIGSGVTLTGSTQIAPTSSGGGWFDKFLTGADKLIGTAGNLGSAVNMWKAGDYKASDSAQVQTTQAAADLQQQMLMQQQEKTKNTTNTAMYIGIGVVVVVVLLTVVLIATKKR